MLAVLSSPPFRATAPDAPGRDGKAGASAEPESWIDAAGSEGKGDIPILGNQGTFLLCVDRVVGYAPHRADRPLARSAHRDSTSAMTQDRIESVFAGPSSSTRPAVPAILVSWLAVFRPCFTAPARNHILVLVTGAVLAPGKRTVTQALRVMGLAERPGFGLFSSSSEPGTVGCARSVTPVALAYSSRAMAQRRGGDRGR